LAQAQGAVEAGRQVAIAQPEPGRVAERREPLDGAEAVAGEPVALLLVDPTRQRVGDDVEVGGDVHAVERVVVAGVDDGGDAFGREAAGEPAQEARGADAPSQRDHGPDFFGGHGPVAGASCTCPRRSRSACRSAWSLGKRLAISRNFGSSTSGPLRCGSGTLIRRGSGAPPFPLLSPTTGTR